MSTIILSQKLSTRNRYAVQTHVAAERNNHSRPQANLPTVEVITNENALPKTRQARPSFLTALLRSLSAFGA